jgi:hypothetical protein
MRRFLALLAVLLLWAGAASADNTQYTLLSAVTTTGASSTSVTALSPSGSDFWVLQFSGTFTAGTTVTVEQSMDGTNWYTSYPGTGATAIATGDILIGPVCNCLTRANVTVHEGGGKTVTVKATLVGAGQLRYQ